MMYSHWKYTYVYIIVLNVKIPASEQEIDYKIKRWIQKFSQVAAVP